MTNLRQLRRQHRIAAQRVRDEEMAVLSDVALQLHIVIDYYRERRTGVSPASATLITQACALLASAQYRHDLLKHPKRQRL